MVFTSDELCARCGFTVNRSRPHWGSWVRWITRSGDPHHAAIASRGLSPGGGRKRVTLDLGLSLTTLASPG